MDVLQWSRHYRCFPGQGGFDLQRFVTRVLDAGYDGPLSLEVFNDVFRQADPDRMAVDAMRSLLILQEALAPRHAPRRLPPATDLDGYAFVEVAIEPASVGETQRVLHALGCAPRAQHRTKPVTLWQHGTARVLLNAAAPQAAGIAAIAVESADPAAAAARAEALLAPILSRHRGPGEADLAAIAAPDGTSVFFCRTDDGGGGGWRQDFVPLEPLGATHEALVEGVDHVALAQPFDYFDEAVLFYRSVLGLEPRESLELAAPDGLVRSRAVTSADGSVRLALNVPVLAADTGAATALQHIAFASRRRARRCAAYGRARRPAARDRRQLLRRPRRPDRARRRPDRRDARPRRPLRPRRARRAPALLHARRSPAASSSRSSSAGATTTATARPTRRSAWPPSGIPTHSRRRPADPEERP